MDPVQKFKEAQFRQILKLQEEISKLQTENFHLKSLLQASVPISKEIVKEALATEELIAEAEINKLKNISDKQLLTLDECRRLTEYVKILQNRRKKESTPEETKTLTDEELLNLLK